MVVAKYLTKPTAKYAKTFPLGLAKTVKPSADACEAAGSEAFFCDYVRSTLLNDPKFGATSEIRQHRLFDGGLTIKTSIDPTTQAQAQNAVDSIIPPGGRVATAIVVMQPGTGNVLAMAVNRVYGDTTDHLPAYGKDPKTGKIVESKDRIHTKYNYATSYPGFQPGSTFKMFTLAAALEKGLSTSTSFFSPGCIYLTNFTENPHRRKRAMHCRCADRARRSAAAIRSGLRELRPGRGRHLQHGEWHRRFGEHLLRSAGKEGGSGPDS